MIKYNSKLDNNIFISPITERRFNIFIIEGNNKHFIVHINLDDYKCQNDMSENNEIYLVLTFILRRWGLLPLIS